MAFSIYHINILSFLFFLFKYSSAASPPGSDFMITSATFVRQRADDLLKSFNLSPNKSVNVAAGQGPLIGDSKIVEKRFRFPISDASSSSIPSVQQLGHHTGYYKIRHSKSSRMFYFFFESRNSKTDPVVIWLTGGPGCGSELAMFYENGPFHISNNLSLVLNEYGWDKVANIIFIDQPIGTGFSYTFDMSDIPHDEEKVSNDLYDFLQAFFTEHPQYVKNDFYITGESYGGHFVPAITSRVHKGNEAKEGIHINLKGFAIGNGLTNPEIQHEAYPDFAFDNGMITKAQYENFTAQFPYCKKTVQACAKAPPGADACWDSFVVCTGIYAQILNVSNNVNHYDIRKKCQGKLCYDFSNMEKFLNKDSVKDALGVAEEIKFVSCSMDVYDAMVKDYMRSVESVIPELLEGGIKLLVYAGDKDFICNWLGNSRWVHAMKWSGQKQFSNSPFVDFKVDKRIAGKLRSYGPLSFLKVFNAGHMVPMDQPKAALQMLKTWMEGKLASGETPSQHVHHKPTGSSQKTAGGSHKTAGGSHKTAKISHESGDSHNSKPEL